MNTVINTVINSTPLVRVGGAAPFSVAFMSDRLQGRMLGLFRLPQAPQDPSSMELQK